MTTTTGARWRNWAGNQQASPARVVHAYSTRDVVDAVRDAVRDGLTVKPIGAGHSFTAIAVTDGVQLDLGGLRGIVSRSDDARVRVRAGTTLNELSRTLLASGLALPNLGDIDVQSVAGAISTGTHGTGARHTGLAGYVTALQLVTGAGEVVEADATTNPELFAAARVGLGAFGVLTEVEIACVPAFRMEAVEEPMSVQTLRRDLDALVDGNDHFEFFWFPYTRSVLTKRNRRLAPNDRSGRPLSRARFAVEDELLSNALFEATCRFASAVPGSTRAINAVAAKALGARTYTDDSFKVFASPRRVRFLESEYAVPRAALGEVMADLSTWLGRTGDFATPFPVEVRFAASDDVWLSTGYERENAYIAVHQYHRLDAAPYLERFEQIVAAHEGRPHWGKLHTLDADRLRALYPRFDDARRVRDEVDPGRVFANPYLERVLG